MAELSQDCPGFSRPERPGAHAVADLAERQWGVVSHRQLVALGVTRGAVEHWLAVGRLRRVHHGVYAPGHAALRIEGRWMAAVLACGDRAALSHQDAAALWGLRPSSTPIVHVTSPAKLHHQAGIRVHRARSLAPEDVTAARGVPVTAVPRTLLDLAVHLSLGDLESVVARALRQRVTDAISIEDVVARGFGHRGRKKLAGTIALDPKVTRSEMEIRFLALLREAGLPEPETNVRLTLGGGEEWEIDALWRRARLSVELDSWRFHGGTRKSFEEDRARAAAMQAAGWRHLQLTWRRLTADPAWVIGTLRALLERPGRHFPG